MSTEVELLRRAAALMRESAQANEPGPWVAEIDERGNAWINLPWCAHAWGMHGFPDEARHVASFASPVVALAVADWLDTCAGIWAGDAQHMMKVATTHGALEVARAYLGEVRDA